MMRIAIVAAALAALPLPAQAAEPPLDFAWPVLRVIDGDTLAVDASADLPAPLAQIRVRLRGIDAPETGHRAECEHERISGKIAQLTAAHLLDQAETVIVRNPEWGKWGGRVVADVILDGERSLAAEMVANFAAYVPGTLIHEIGYCEGSAPRKRPPLARRDVLAEVERFVVEPCIADGLASPQMAATLTSIWGAENTAAAAKAGAAAASGRFADILLPLVREREPESRAEFYAVFREICVSGGLNRGAGY